MLGDKLSGDKKDVSYRKIIQTGNPTLYKLSCKTNNFTAVIVKCIAIGVLLNYCGRAITIVITH